MSGAEGAALEGIKGMRYRINYGNGQVDCVGCSLARCRRELPSCGPFAFIQFQDGQTGDWFRIREKAAKAA